MATALKPSPQMTTEEHEARKLLASCYRVFDMMGWSEMIYNHITLKVPGEEDAFLINPYGLHFSEVCASNLVKINSKATSSTDHPIR
jgi:ribulose-5-phosphate 4-epimerase/fuculose-1-phosphate aldolase